MATRCTHLTIDGARCTMLAVNGKDLCFSHESRLLRMRQKPSLPGTFATAPLVSFVYPDDADAITENLFNIARALGMGMINDRTASVMDRIMDTALRTLRAGQKIEHTTTSKELIQAFRLDEHGNARVVDPEPVPDPFAQVPDIRTESATAEVAQETSPQPPLRHQPHRTTPQPIPTIAAVAAEETDEEATRNAQDLDTETREPAPLTRRAQKQENSTPASRHPRSRTTPLHSADTQNAKISLPTRGSSLESQRLSPGMSSFRSSGTQ